MFVDFDDARFWRRVALTIILLVLGGYGFTQYVSPRLQEAHNAAVYIDACVTAKICPDAAQINERLPKAPGTAASVPPPTSAPAAPPSNAPPVKK